MHTSFKAVSVPVLAGLLCLAIVLVTGSPNVQVTSSLASKRDFSNIELFTRMFSLSAGETVHVAPIHLVSRTESPTLGNQVHTYLSLGAYEITWYTSHDPGVNHITASGAKAKEGYTAACPPSLPMGIQLSIQGIGQRVCQDRGGAIKGRHIDVYVDTLTQAKKNGVQYHSVYEKR